MRQKLAILSFAPIFVFLVFFPRSILASNVGDACTGTSNLYMQEGVSSGPGFKPQLICNGSTLQNFLGYSSSGYLGIGTTSPAYGLDNIGTAHFQNAPGVSGHTVNIQANAAQGAGYLLRFLDSSGSLLTGIDGSGIPNLPGNAYIGFASGKVGNTSNLISGNPGGLGIQSSSTISIATGGVAEKVRIDSSGNVGIGTPSPNAALDINSTSMIIEQSHTPADNATCTAGTIWWDTSYIYVCTASGTVKRATLSAF